MISLVSKLMTVVSRVSGNHAQALALAAQLCGAHFCYSFFTLLYLLRRRRNKEIFILIRVCLSVPLCRSLGSHRHASECKKAAVAGYGATIVLCDNSQAAREAALQSLTEGSSY